MPFALKFRQTERKPVFWLFMGYEGRVLTINWPQDRIYGTEQSYNRAA
jgi:hypothetical protein